MINSWRNVCKCYQIFWPLWMLCSNLNSIRKSLHQEILNRIGTSQVICVGFSSYINYVLLYIFLNFFLRTNNGTSKVWFWYLNVVKTLELLILIESAMFGTTIIFGTIKDDSLSINTLASNNLCHRNVFQNSINFFLKNG